MNTFNEISIGSYLTGHCAFNKNLCYYNEHGIVLRNDEDFKHDKKNVVVISGSGGGHEPGLAGYVGKGFLSSAVCGNVFTSPSVTSCLNAVLLANDPLREILVVILNYTGDRLNFGLAIEMACNIHNFQNIKMLIVDDDCAIDNPGRSTGRRGLAGGVLINKIAGAMSAKGSSLTEIYNFCNFIIDHRLLRTIGFCFNHELVTNELKKVEIGYGIHGEPGSMKFEREKNFEPIISIMKEKLRLNSVKVDVVILFNNLGGASEFIFWQFIQEFLKDFPVTIVKVYAGKFLTSLSKEAISVSVLEVRDPKIIDFLEFHVDIGVGHLFNCPIEVCKPVLKIFQVPKTTGVKTFEGALTERENLSLKKIILKICIEISNLKEYFNNLDSELGDGDTGSTLARGADALKIELNANRLDMSSPHDMLLQISNILMNSMGGTSGAIFSIFLQCASKAFTTENYHSCENWINGIFFGMEGIMRHGKAQFGDRTLLDSLQSGHTAMKNKSLKTIDTFAVLDAFAEGCREGAENTKNMKAKSGRNSYALGDKPDDFIFCSQYPDPGAQVVSVVSKTISDTMKLFSV